MKRQPDQDSLQTAFGSPTNQLRNTLRNTEKCNVDKLQLAKTYIPQEAIEVAVPHVLEHHGQRLAIGAHAVEANNVLVLQHRQKFRLPLKVLPSRLVGIFQGLWTHTHVQDLF